MARLNTFSLKKNSLFHGYRLKADTQWSSWQEFNAGPKHASHSNSLFNLRMSMAGKNRHLKNCSYQLFLYFAAVKTKDIHVCTTCGLHVSMPWKEIWKICNPVNMRDQNQIMRGFINASIGGLHYEIFYSWGHARMHLNHRTRLPLNFNSRNIYWNVVLALYWKGSWKRTRKSIRKNISEFYLLRGKQ